MSKRNYNLFALQGHELDDLDFREQMKEEHGIDIPVDLVNTPKINDYVIQETYNRNVNDLQGVTNTATGQKYTEKEAIEEAKHNRNAAMKNVSSLMKANRAGKI